jgi:hypothetical protein
MADRDPMPRVCLRVHLAELGEVLGGGAADEQ